MCELAPSSAQHAGPTGPGMQAPGEGFGEGGRRLCQKSRGAWQAGRLPPLPQRARQRPRAGRLIASHKRKGPH